MMITGGSGSGKTAFALKLAEKFDHAGIWLVSRWPDKDAEQIAESVYPWKIIETHPILPEIIDTINVNSNPFVTNSRVLVVDNIAVWLYHEAKLIAQREQDDDRMHRLMAERADTLIESITAYQGTILVITNEMNGYWDEVDIHKILFHHWLPIINARLTAKCSQLFLLTSGVAVELTSRQVRLGGN
jgi:adenosylcobinamide kinase/adenosylcobinamide-phosphate guanylyltransferase